MPTIVGILTFMTRSSSMPMWVEHEDGFITSVIAEKKHPSVLLLSDQGGIVIVRVSEFVSVADYDC